MFFKFPSDTKTTIASYSSTLPGCGYTYEATNGKLTNTATGAEVTIGKDGTLADGTGKTIKDVFGVSEGNLKNIKTGCIGELCNCDLSQQFRITIVVCTLDTSVCVNEDTCHCSKLTSFSGCTVHCSGICADCGFTTVV